MVVPSGAGGPVCGGEQRFGFIVGEEGDDRLMAESLNYQLRKVAKACGHFPGDDAVVRLLWLVIINIEDKRARERAARRSESGKRSDQPARLIEGQRVMG